MDVTVKESRAVLRVTGPSQPGLPKLYTHSVSHAHFLWLHCAHAALYTSKCAHTTFGSSGMKMKKVFVCFCACHYSPHLAFLFDVSPVLVCSVSTFLMVNVTGLLYLTSSRAFPAPKSRRKRTPTLMTRSLATWPGLPPHMEQTRRIQLCNHTWSKAKRIRHFMCSIAMVTRFTAGEHLDDPGHLSVPTSRPPGICRVNNLYQEPIFEDNDCPILED